MCSQGFSRTGFAPAHGVCAFPIYTAQAPGCSAGNCLRRALVYTHFPGLSRSGSGYRVLHKGSDLVGPAFCARPWSEQLRWPGAWHTESPLSWRLRLTPSPVSAARFSGWATGAPSWVCRVSILGSWSLAVALLADVDHPEPQEVLVSNKVCLQFGRGCLSGADCPLSRSGCPRLPVSISGWAGPQPASSVSPLFCERSWLCLRLGLFAGIAG